MIPRIDAKTLEELVIQVNKRLDLIDREFAQKYETKIILEKEGSLSEIASGKIKDLQLKVRDNAGTLQLIIRYKNLLHTVDLTTQTP